MSEEAHQKMKAYEAFNKMRLEKDNEKLEQKNEEIRKQKEQEIQELLQLEEQLVERVSKTKNVKKGICKHFEQFVSYIFPNETTKTKDMNEFPMKKLTNINFDLEFDNEIKDISHCKDLIGQNNEVKEYEDDTAHTL